MANYDYIYRFEKYGLGIFVHFGLYSLVGKGEWYLNLHPKANKEKYEQLVNKFKVNKSWAKDLVKLAKKAGAKYITITTRHHDGFSLYDTCGLNDYDAPHSASKRDLIKEFVAACNEGGVVPFFYHTLLDWYAPTFKTDFNAYLDYLYKSVEILCTKYGKIGGLWFDGFWSNPKADWKFDRLYQMIKHYQPEAMIINNTGVGERGNISHPLVDSVTSERGKPNLLINASRPLASEMCETTNDHWGYAKHDICYKPIPVLIDTLLTCRENNANLLLNIGPKGNGSIPIINKITLTTIGDFIRLNKNFIYNIKKADIEANNAVIVKDDKHYYAIIHYVSTYTNTNPALDGETKNVLIKTDKKVVHAKYLDNNHKIKLTNNIFKIEPFVYGTSYFARVVQFDLE